MTGEGGPKGGIGIQHFWTTEFLLLYVMKLKIKNKYKINKKNPLKDH